MHLRAIFPLPTLDERGRLAVLFSTSFLAFMAYAVFKTGGKQYRVAQGDILDVEKLDLEVGGTTTFSDLLFYVDGETTKVAKDLSGASVSAEVVEQRKDAKVIAYKYRRREGYHRTVGHRQKLSRVKVTGIKI